MTPTKGTREPKKNKNTPAPQKTKAKYQENQQNSNTPSQLTHPKGYQRSIQTLPKDKKQESVRSKRESPTKKLLI